MNEHTKLIWKRYMIYIDGKIYKYKYGIIYYMTYNVKNQNAICQKCQMFVKYLFDKNVSI